MKISPIDNELTLILKDVGLISDGELFYEKS